ncbi:MAG: sigma-70 family RNA polymerase sigma factor [bacterium]|nr:sigma-70 family RNA polymerase sigma factor [bacterium]
MTEDLGIRDEDIALRVQRGDIESFGLLVSRYEVKMTKYARKFLFNANDAKDLVQEVFLKTYINIQSFDPSRKFSSWLYRIAHNEYINAVKKRGKEPVFFFDLDVFLPHAASPHTTESEAMRQELKRSLEEHLGALGLKYREVLVLYYLEDMDYREISEILQIPVSTVGVRLARGKDLLRKSITKADSRV